MKPDNLGKVVNVSLHHFSDASELGYGQLGYKFSPNTRLRKDNPVTKFFKTELQRDKSNSVIANKKGIFKVVRNFFIKTLPTNNAENIAKFIDANP